MFEGPAPGRTTATAAAVHVSASGQKIEASWIVGSDNQMAGIIDTTDDEAAAKARVKVAAVSLFGLTASIIVSNWSGLLKFIRIQRKVPGRLLAAQLSGVGHASGKLSIKMTLQDACRDMVALTSTGDQ